MMPLKHSKSVALIIFLVALGFNEWAFRFIFPLEPIDSFLRLMTLVLDGFLLILVFAFGVSGQSINDRTNHLFQNQSRLVSILLGSFVSYCLIMAVEFGCRYYFKQVYTAPYAEQTFWEPSAVIPDTIIGTSLPKNTLISHTLIVNDSLIYKQNYSTDTFGRRISPVLIADTSATQFAMVTGCSFAFGYGLNERQTLSYYLDSLNAYRGYNYGISGHGTQQTLALLENRVLSAEIEETNGVLIHLFIDDHLPRLIGSRRLIKLWASNFPYYYLDGEELKRDGSFWSGRPLLSRFYKAISQSAFIDLFDIDFPWYVSNSHMNLFGAVLENAQIEFKKQYPEGRFLVVIAPNSKLAPRVIETLSGKNVEFLDLSKLLDKKSPEYKIHWTEGHPNGNYYLEIATEVDAHLNPTN
ncbi:MAG: hypothetical protein ACI9EQ_000227 [Bacteroidia bacterium]|jgi:hypothetical protein